MTTRKGIALWGLVGLGQCALSGAAAQNSGAEPTIITVDAQAGRHPISPLIYGVAFANPAQLQALNSPLNRSGGNAETRYNWKDNSSNRAADWYFASLPENPLSAGSGDTISVTGAGSALRAGALSIGIGSNVEFDAGTSGTLGGTGLAGLTIDGGLGVTGALSVAGGVQVVGTANGGSGAHGLEINGGTLSVTARLGWR